MKKLLIVAGCLVLVGVILFVGIMSYLKWDFSKLSFFKTVTTEYEVDTSFERISVVAKTADISLLPSRDGKTRVVSSAPEKLLCDVSVKDEGLVITFNDTRRWYEKINTGSTAITVYLPAVEYDALNIELSTGDTKISDAFSFKALDIRSSTGDVQCYSSAHEALNIFTSTGDVEVMGISAGDITVSLSTGDIDVKNVACSGNIKLSVSTGDIQISSVTCVNLATNGSTGDVKLTDLVAVEVLNIERSTGDVRLNACDADEINIKTSTGDVFGSFLTPKIIFAHTDTGKVNVPELTSGGKCKIETGTGNITVRIEE